MARKQPSTALVRVDAAAQLGPALLALPSDMMRAFVIALVTTGCTAAEAARVAGYSASSQNTLSSKGCQLAHDPRIQAALHEEGVKSLRASGVAGISILREIASNKQEAARDRIAAVKELMGRGGFSATTEHNITVTHRTEGEIDAELLALASELGFSDEQKSRLVGRPVVRKLTDVIDADFSDAAPVESEGSREGLEDLLPLAAHESGTETDEDPTIGDEI